MNRRISYRRYRRRFVRPLRTARGEWAVREGWLLRVEADGSAGYGEVAPIPEFGTETFDEAEAFLERLKGDPGLPVPEELPCCAFALSAASSAFSGVRRAYPVAGLLPAGEAAVPALASKSKAGFRCFKWKIGVGGLALEQEILDELVAQLPGGGRLRLDANAALSAAEAATWTDCCARFPGCIEFLEQPLPVGEERAMAGLAAASGVPVALDESLNGPAGSRWLESGAWAGPLVVKAALMGDVARLAERLRPVARRVVWSSAFETGVGLEAALRLADGLPASPYAVGFDTLDAFEDGLMPLDRAPVLTPAARATMDFADLWKRLPHSS
ncbi:MAG: o-succinylbenzoate synthase [Opitutales bacterium]